MLRKSEMKTEIDSLLRMKTYWIKNNSLNFIDRIIKERPLTKKQSVGLLKLKKSIEGIKINCWNPESNLDSIFQIKKILFDLQRVFSL